jgi:hypothetical protein
VRGRGRAYFCIRRARREVLFVIVCVVRIDDEASQFANDEHISENAVRHRAKRDKKPYVVRLWHICK